MKKIYVVYGRGACGKSSFIKDNIYNSELDRLEYGCSELNEFVFLKKGSPEFHTYRNLIFDDCVKFCETSSFSRAKARSIAYPLLNYQRCWKNIFFICQEKHDVDSIVERIKENVKDIKVKYLDFGE